MVDEQYLGEGDKPKASDEMVDVMAEKVNAVIVQTTKDSVKTLHLELLNSYSCRDVSKWALQRSEQVQRGLEIQLPSGQLPVLGNSSLEIVGRAQFRQLTEVN